MIEGVIFDFNGTLLKDSDFNESAWKKVLEKYSGHELTDEEIKKTHGMTNDQIIPFVLGEEFKDQISKISEEKETIYRQSLLDSPERLVLAEGAEDYFSFLNHIGIPYTIASSAGKGNIDFYFEHLPLRNYFDPDTIVYDNGTLPCKPAPDYFLEASRRLKVPAERCLVFEDSSSGFQAAKNAKAGLIVGLGLHAAGNPIVNFAVENFTDPKLKTLF